MQSLLRLTEAYPNLRFLDAVRDLKLTHLEFVQMSNDKIRIESTLDGFICLRCPQFQEHVCLSSFPSLK